MQSNIRRRLFWFWLCILLAVPAHAQPSLLPQLQELRRLYPTPMTEFDAGALLIRTAQSAPGWVLLAKPNGKNCPAMGVRVSCDYLVYAATGQGFDVLRDVDGQGVAVWNAGDRFTADRYVYVSVSAPPVPTPGTNVPNSGTEDLHAELNAMLGLMGELDAKIAAIQLQQAKDRADVLALVEQLSKNVEEQKPGGKATVIKNLLLLLSALGAGIGASK